MTSDVLADAKRRLLELTLKGWGPTGSQGISQQDREEATALALLLAPRTLPGPEQRAADDSRISELHYKVLTPGFGSLSEAQQDEVVEIVARQARYNASPDGIDRARRFTLMLKKFSQQGLTTTEQTEYFALQANTPTIDPADPLASAFASRLLHRGRVRLGVVLGLGSIVI